MALQVSYSKFGIMFPEAYVKINDFGEEYTNNTAAMSVRVFTSQQARSNGEEAAHQQNYSIDRSALTEYKQDGDTDIRQTLYRWLKAMGTDGVDYTQAQDV